MINKYGNKNIFLSFQAP